MAEETINPQRNVLIGFGSAILTLVVLCLLTFGSSVGVGGWENVVFPNGVAEYNPDGSLFTSDAPLPLAVASIPDVGGWILKLIGFIGLFGLVASFHGIILAAGRATFEFGRVGYAPKFLGNVQKKFKTPANALLINMLIGLVALLSGKTGEIITIAVFGALSLYIISMVSLLALRKK